MNKPKAWRIGDLVDYIRNPQRTNAHEKIAHAGSRNFITDTHCGQRAEMIALSQETVRSKMPVSHWIFSWKEGEQPTPKQIDEAVDMFLKGMELEGHQTIYALHQDTANFHLHIAINRMNEVTGKVVCPHKGFDIKAAHRIMAQIEHKQGWSSTDNALYTVLENGEIAERKDIVKTIKPKPKGIEFEHATGEKSAQRIAQEKGHGIISKAKTWEELHENLQEVGLRFEKKGSGAVVFVPTAKGEIAIKASSIDRNFSMGKLSKKLGDFVVGEYPKEEIDTAPPPKAMPEASIEPTAEPVSPVNVEEWKEYQADCAAITQENKDEDKKIAEEQKLSRLKKKHKKEREKAIANLKSHGISILNIARYFLSRQQKEEIRKLREEIQSKVKRRLRFVTWLQHNGLEKEAELWRYRNNFENPPMPEQVQYDKAQDLSPEAMAFEEYVQAVNADRYRVTCIKMEENNKKVFILDKKNGVTKGFTPDEMLTHLDEMKRLQAQGENIYYTPLSDDKHHILIDDMTAESVNTFLKKGYKPAVILESSPNNYQCILTIPKLCSAFDRDIGNRLTEGLNKAYGDKKLSGCIHPHRAPEFSNLKDKHRQADGTLPKVQLLESKKQECARAYEISKLLLQELEEATKAKRERERKTRKIPDRLPIGSPASAYYVHYDNIQKHMAIDDFSRMDAMIALRMRATGHSPQAVFEAMFECAKNTRMKEGRDWYKYAERTANYAFGVAGDIALQKYEKYHEHWHRIEHGERATQNAPTPRLRM